MTRTEFLVGALVAAAVLVVLVWARYAIYRARHPYSEGDLVGARADALKRSQAVVSGKVGEHFAPFFPALLARFSPRDARFLGAPIDFVIFDGLDEGDVREVVFVEVKAGARGQLSGRERLIRKAVDEGRVRFEVFAVPGAAEVDEG
jgi:predicted Holliday junction resolvase-like endonuclease